MLILASASPRRQELLRNAGIRFEVRPANIHEIRGEGELAEDYVIRLAKEKAEITAHQIGNMSPNELVILGADTTVVVDQEVLEKPRDTQEAMRMLRLLSGRSHEVMTGVCLLVQKSDGWKFFTALEKTKVIFTGLTEEEVQDYVATGEPLDKAGAYAIQGIASRWIPRIEGCYFNVVGLPIPLVCRLLKEHVPWLIGIRNS